MVKISLAGFKDPVRRPRYIIWTGVVVLLFAAFVVVALGVTSTYWFCANVCHKVQDDSISAYNRSAHSKISCLACHMPVQADPITFLIHKAEAGILGGIHTVTNNYENPLNPESHVALAMMPEGQCTQCHSENRVITPGPGIIIDHEIHSEEGVHCTLCHNRTAHDESGDWEPVTRHPQTGEVPHKHADFMEMTACFRCHGLESDAKAPGACAKCHPADFELKPESHFKGDFYPRGHADMALTEIERVAEAMAEGAHGEEGSEEATEGEEGSEESTESEEGSEEATESKDGASLLGPEKAYASGGTESEWVESMPSMEQVNYCSTCHKQSFCDSCHGMELPHPKEFVEKSHPELVKTKFDKCDMCHQITKTGYKFCNDCHHGTKSNWKYDPKIAWETQHAKTVATNGVDLCLEACHKTTFCSDCHTKKKPVPSSHAAKDWLRKRAEALGAHAEGFKAQPTSCEVCHGPNEPNGNKFCKGCHELEMPHQQEFKDFHAKTGRDNRKVCANCHTFKELCSDCHHEGAVNGTPWLKVHGPIVNKSGGAGCLEKCHKQDFCVDCHTSKKVVPASHKVKGWTKRPSLNKPALHPAGFEKQPDGCAYCHGTGGAKAKFCSNCHKLEMPHPDGYGAEGKGNGGVHQSGFADKSLKKATCENCHTTPFCNKCHHGYDGSKPWVNYHPATVKKSGAAPCFECHEETYCSYCHVREASKYLKN